MERALQLRFLIADVALSVGAIIAVLGIVYDTILSGWPLVIATSVTGALAGHRISRLLQLRRLEPSGCIALAMLGAQIAWFHVFHLRLLKHDLGPLVTHEPTFVGGIIGNFVYGTLVLGKITSLPRLSDLLRMLVPGLLGALLLVPYLGWLREGNLQRAGPLDLFRIYFPMIMPVAFWFFVPCFLILSLSVLPWNQQGHE